jgi:hypothetical protein
MTFQIGHEGLSNLVILEFEEVWPKILRCANKSREVSTLDRGIVNRIVSLTDSAIVVVSEKTKRQRSISKKDFQRCWSVLIADGRLFIPPVHVWNERIIMAFLAHLPYVEYSLRPLTLHLVPQVTHPLCTTRKKSN